MPKTLPQIDYCIVCEGLRPELGGKATILGFFGLLPRVKIIMQDWGQPIATLLFLVGTHGGSERFTVQANVLNPDGSKLTSAEIEFDSTEPDAGMNANVGFGFMPIKFSQKGQHAFQLLFDGVEHYKESFTVSAAPH